MATTQSTDETVTVEANDNQRLADKLRSEAPSYARIKWAPCYGDEFRVEVDSHTPGAVFDAIHDSGLRVAELFTNLDNTDGIRIVAVPA